MLPLLWLRAQGIGFLPVVMGYNQEEATPLPIVFWELCHHSTEPVGPSSIPALAPS